MYIQRNTSMRCDIRQKPRMIAKPSVNHVMVVCLVTLCVVIKIKQRTGKMANRLRKDVSARRTGRTPPRQPDYRDELSDSQLSAIKKLTECEEGASQERELLYSPAW